MKRRVPVWFALLVFVVLLNVVAFAVIQLGRAADRAALERHLRAERARDAAPALELPDPR